MNLPGILRRIGAGAAILLGGAGCSNYRLGTGGDRGIETLYVAPVVNTAAVPQATALVSRELRLAFVRDGRVALADSAERADAVLTVTLSEYGREMTTSLPTDTGRARKFDVTLNATCRLVDASGAVLFERDIDATRQVFTDEGQLPAEYQNLPLHAQLLADRVQHAVLDVW